MQTSIKPFKMFPLRSARAVCALEEAGGGCVELIGKLVKLMVKLVIKMMVKMVAAGLIINQFSLAAVAAGAVEDGGGGRARR